MSVRSAPQAMAHLVTSFFTRHLVAELDASPNTIRSYRDAFRLLLGNIALRNGKTVSALGLQDLSPEAILDFLEHLEKKRGNTARTRNARLAAIHSFFSYVVRQDVASASLAQKILAIPFKRTPGRLLDYLTEDELRGILSGPDRTTAKGRRDYLALSLLYDTGARVQELLDLCPADLRLDRPALVRITGKGRKQRLVPLLPATASLIRHHLVETTRQMNETKPLVLNYRGEQMTRSGIAFLLDRYRKAVGERMPGLRNKRISPHTLRHTKAMHLLQSGVSPVTIKDILGHAHLKTLEVYVQADLKMKRQALEAAGSPVRRRSPEQVPTPDLLRWLEQL